ISPGMISRSTPRSTSIRSPPCSNERVSPVRRTTGLLIAQHLHRIRPRCAIGRIERGEEAEPHRHRADQHDLDRVGLRRQLGEEAYLRVAQVLPGDELEAAHDRLAELENEKAER